ncbi:MAG: hypothetical protein AAF799_42745 [Myxococcota bacterium]
MPLAPEDIRRIAAMEDKPALRNLLITHSYHELSLGMRELFGPTNVFWPAFACWASRQAGAFIRQDEIPAIIRRLVQDDPEERSRRPRLMDGSKRVREHKAAIDDDDTLDFDPLDAIDDIIDRVSIFVGTGNRIVFEELGNLFSRFIQSFRGATEYDQAALDAFLEPIAEGPSLEDTATVDADGTVRRSMNGGRSLLRTAMTHLYRALFEQDANKRAELILLSNSQFGLHEQIRLQVYIEGAQNAPVEALFLRNMERRGMSPADAQAKLGSMGRELETLVRNLTTELMMTMRLPDETIQLGRDLEAAPGQSLWPEELEHLEEPELVALTVKLGTYETREANLDWTDRVEGWFDGILSKLSIGSPEAQGTGARDWSALGERMRFIFALFRSRQQNQRLCEAPFTDDQVAAMKAGFFPVGDL